MTIAKWITVAIGERDKRIKELEALIDAQRGDTTKVGSKDQQIGELKAMIDDQANCIETLNRQLLSKVKEISLLEAKRASRPKMQAAPRATGSKMRAKHSSKNKRNEREIMGAKGREPKVKTGDIVSVQSLNKSGMHSDVERAWVTRVNDDDTVDIKYVLGGTARDISFQRITRVVETPNRPNRASSAAARSGKNICPLCHRRVRDVNPGGEIMCDGCAQWFHLRCMGETRTWGHKRKEYHCEQCKSRASKAVSR